MPSKTVKGHAGGPSCFPPSEARRCIFLVFADEKPHRPPAARIAPVVEILHWAEASDDALPPFLLDKQTSGDTEGAGIWGIPLAPFPISSLVKVHFPRSLDFSVSLHASWFAGFLAFEHRCLARMGDFFPRIQIRECAHQQTPFAFATIEKVASSKWFEAFRKPGQADLAASVNPSQ